MTKAEVIAELIRRYPDGVCHQARETFGVPANPGWRCMVTAWNPGQNGKPRINVFGRGDTWESALADAERREALPAPLYMPNVRGRWVDRLDGSIHWLEDGGA